MSVLLPFPFLLEYEASEEIPLDLEGVEAVEDQEHCIDWLPGSCGSH